MWLRDALQSTNARQLNNGRTATEVMEEQLDRLLPSRVSAGVQGFWGKLTRVSLSQNKRTFKFLRTSDLPDNVKYP